LLFYITAADYGHTLRDSVFLAAEMPVIAACKSGSVHRTERNANVQQLSSNENGPWTLGTRPIHSPQLPPSGLSFPPAISCCARARKMVSLIREEQPPPATPTSDTGSALCYTRYSFVANKGLSEFTSIRNRYFIMAALCNRTGHYIFIMWFLSSIFFSFPRLILNPPSLK